MEPPQTSRRTFLGRVGLGFGSLFGALPIRGESDGSRTPLTALAFSPDGRALVSNGPQCIRVRDPHTGRELRRIPTRLSRIEALVFHPSGNLLLAVGGAPGETGGLEIGTWPDLKTLTFLPMGTDCVSDAAFHPDGSMLGVVGSDGSAALWPFQDSGMLEKQERRLEGHVGPVLGIAFSPDGKLAVTTGMDRSVKVWDVPSGQARRTFTQHTDRVLAVHFLPEDRQLSSAQNTLQTEKDPPSSAHRPVQCVTVSDDRTVRVWQPALGRMVRIVRPAGGPFLAVCPALHGKSYFVAGTGGSIQEIDTYSDRILRSWNAHPDWILRLAIHPAGDRLASGDWTGALKITPL